MSRATHLWMSRSGYLLRVVARFDLRTEADRERGEVPCDVVGDDPNGLGSYILRTVDLVSLGAPETL